MGRTLSTIVMATALAAGSLHTRSVAASVATPLDAPLSKCIAREADQLDFSGVVSITNATGRSDYARGRVNGPESAEVGSDTPFNLASVGKMFTAVAIVQLVEQGKLALDDPVGRFVDGLASATRVVTVRQLMTHSAGLGNFFTPDSLAVLERARTVSELLPLVAAEEPEFAPGSRFEYSNSGFLLLGRVIESASGMPYDEYLRVRIFQPAGMASTSVDTPSESARAVGMTTWPNLPPHRPGQTTERSLPPPGPMRPAPEAAFRGSPAGGSYSSASDLQRFFAALIDGRLISPSMLRMLTSPQILVRPAQDGTRQVDFGLGVGIGSFEGHRWFGHNGGAPGANTEVAFFPDERIGVVVMANRDPPIATELFRRVRRLVFDPTACASAS